MKEKPQTLRVELLGGFRVSLESRTVGEDGWRLKKAKGLVKLLDSVEHRFEHARVVNVGRRVPHH